MSDNPKVLDERISSRPGVPLISRSSGTVISCSTSSAARPGICVVTCAATSPNSGYASTDSVSQAYTPKPRSRAASTMTATRRFRQSSTSWSIIEKNPALHDHLLTWLDSRVQCHGVAFLQFRCNRSPLERPRRCSNEDRSAVVVHEQGG